MVQNEQLPDQLDDYIRSGIKQAKGVKKKRHFRNMTGITCFLVLTIFLGAVRVSPAFASYVAAIPGLEYLVDMIRFDKGLQSAVENEFVQNINVSDEHQGIRFTVKDIIVDNTSMVVFYSIENDSEYEMPRLRDIKTTDGGNREIPMVVSHGFGPYDDPLYNGRINISFPGDEAPDFQMPDTVNLAAAIEVGNPDKPEEIAVLEGTWDASIPIDKSKFEDMEKHYALNQTVTIGWQRIRFEKAIIYPTRIAVDLSFDESNTMNIFALEDLVLVDEGGNEWGTIQNGVTGTHISSNKRRLFFQSNYFTEPEKLSIRGSGIRALDKDKSEIVIDLEKKQIAKAPDDKVQLKDLNFDESSLSITLQLEKDPKYTNYQYGFLSWHSWDYNNQELDSEGSSWGSGGNWTYNEYDYKFTFDSPIQGPVRFEILDYPNRLVKDFEVQILP